MNKLFSDLKTDEEKSAFFLSGRGYETGVIAPAIQNDVAMAYHRCAEYEKEVEALRKDVEAIHWKDAEIAEAEKDKLRTIFTLVSAAGGTIRVPPWVAVNLRSDDALKCFEEIDGTLVYKVVRAKLGEGKKQLDTGEAP